MPFKDKIFIACMMLFTLICIIFNIPSRIEIPIQFVAATIYVAITRFFNKK